LLLLFSASYCARTEICSYASSILSSTEFITSLIYRTLGLSPLLGR
jgi:hypothetical protein